MSSNWVSIVRRDYASAIGTTARALRVSAVRRVVLAFGAASAIEAATWLAVGVYAYERSGATGVGLVGIAILLPSAIAAPVAATLADRRRRKAILLASFVFQVLALGATAIAMRAGAPSAVVYVAAMLAAVGLTPIRPAQGALLASIAPGPADLTAANVALTTVRNVGLLAGPLGAGVLLRLSDASSVYAVAALVGVVAGTLVAGVPGDRPRERAAASVRRSVTEGLRMLLGEERATLVVALVSAKHVVMGAARAFLVIVALELLRMGDGGPSVLSAALGVGGSIGGVTALLLVGRRRLTPALVVGAILLGLPIAALGVRSAVALALVGMAVVGVGRSLIDVAGRTLLARVSPEEALARFFGILEGSSYAGLALGSGAAALLVHSLGTRSALLAAGVFLPAIVVLLARPLTSMDVGPLVSKDRLDLILGVPMFAPLPAASVERLASRLEPVDARAGTTVIREGDIGDRFYILEHGTAQTEIGGRVVSSLGAGEAFGEIALLHDVPRTATVRTTTAARLMALDRAEFLSVLTDEPASMIRAERTATERLLGRSADDAAVASP